MPQAAMLYARPMSLSVGIRPSASFNAASGNAIRATWNSILLMILSFCFNAASGNAIRATKWLDTAMRTTQKFQCRKRQCYTRDTCSICGERFSVLSEFQCRKRQCYTRDRKQMNFAKNYHVFQCRKRQCYTRDTLSLAARVITGLRQRFSQPSRFFLEMGAFFVDTVFSKSPKTSCHPLISKGSSCPRFFVATSPVFRGKNEKIFLLPVYHFPVAACNSFCKFSRAFIVY